MFNGPPQWDHMYGHATPLAEKLMGPSSKAKESTQFENTTRCQWVISQGKHAIQNANCGIQQIPYWVQCGIKLCQFPWTPGRTFKLPKITNNGIWDWNGENHTRNIWLSSIIWYIIYTNDYKYIYISLSSLCDTFGFVLLWITSSGLRRFVRVHVHLLCLGGGEAAKRCTAWHTSLVSWPASGSQCMGCFKVRDRWKSLGQTLCFFVWSIHYNPIVFI